MFLQLFVAETTQFELRRHLLQGLTERVFASRFGVRCFGKKIFNIRGHTKTFFHPVVRKALSVAGTKITMTTLVSSS